MLTLPQGVELVSEPSPARWIVERLRPWDRSGVRVASFVPEGFEAYARILHPAYRVAYDVGTVRWCAIAERRGREVGPEAGFSEVLGLDPNTREWQDAVPSDGNLPREQSQALIPVLRDLTSTPDACWFCIWEGYGFWWAGAHSPLVAPGAGSDEITAYRRQALEQDELLTRTPRVRAEARAYFLFRGPLSAAASFEFGPWRQSPNLWWPDDRAWCVATEIDAYSTYVGASRRCVDRIVGAPDLEAIEVRPDTRFDPGP